MRSLSIVLAIALSVVGCSDEATFRSDVPLTRGAAAKKINFTLPASAHDVYFLVFSGGLQNLEQYVRFDVSPEDLQASVDELVAENNRQMRRSLPYGKAPLVEAKLAPPRKEFLPMVWWNPNAVQTGFYRGEIDAYALRILVDDDNSRIYVYQND